MPIDHSFPFESKRDQLRSNFYNFIRKIDPTLLLEPNYHLDNSYVHNKVLVDRFCQLYDNHTTIRSFCKDHMDPKHMIKVDDLIMFFTYELHHPKSPYYSNHSSNTVGKYCIYIETVYAIVGIPVVNYVPQLRSLTPEQRELIAPKRDEFMILNHLNYFAKTNPVFAKYYDRYLVMNYQQSLGTNHKFDASFGNIVDIEVNENSEDHDCNLRDDLKSDISLINGRSLFTILVSHYQKSVDNRNKILLDLENILVKHLLKISSEFRMDYSYFKFREILRSQIKVRQDELKRFIELSPDRDNKNIKSIKEQKIELLRDILELLSDQNTANANLIIKLFDYKDQCIKAKKIGQDIYPISFEFITSVLFRLDNTDTNSEKILEHIKALGTINTEGKYTFNYESVVQIVNDIRDDKVERIRNVNFKYLLVVQEIYESYFDKIIDLDNEMLRRYMDAHKRTIEHKSIETNRKIKDIEAKYEKSMNLSKETIEVHQNLFKNIYNMNKDVSLKSQEMNLPIILGVDVIENAKKDFESALNDIKAIRKPKFNYQRLTTLITRVRYLYDIVNYDDDEIVLHYDALKSGFDREHIKGLKNEIQDIIKNLDIELTNKRSFIDHYNSSYRAIEDTCNITVSYLQPIIENKSKKSIYTINTTDIGKSIINEIPDLGLVYTGNEEDQYSGMKVKAIFDTHHIPNQLFRKIHAIYMGLAEGTKLAFPDTIPCISDSYVERHNEEEEDDIIIPDLVNDSDEELGQNVDEL